MRIINQELVLCSTQFKCVSVYLLPQAVVPMLPSSADGVLQPTPCTSDIGKSKCYTFTYNDEICAVI